VPRIFRGWSEKLAGGVGYYQKARRLESVQRLERLLDRRKNDDMRNNEWL